MLLGIDLQHALVYLRRRATVADLVGPQRGGLHEDVHLLGGVGQRLGAPLEDVDRLFPARLLHEQPLERRERPEVGTIELEHLAPGVDRVLRAHEGLALELAELREQLLELVALDAAAAELADLDQTAQRLRQLFPGARAAVVGRDGPERIDVLRIDLQDLLPALERVPLARELLAPDAAEALVDRDAGLGIGGGRDLLFEDLGQLLPLAGHLVQIGQTRQRDGVLAAHVDHAAPQLDGLVAVVERVGGQLGHPRVAIGQRALVVGDLGQLLVDTVEIAPALAAEVEPLEGFQRLARAGLVLEDRQVARDGRVDLFERFAVDAPQAQVEADQIDGVVGDGQPLAQDAGQVLVHPLALVDAIERGQRGGILVVLAEHLEERLFGPLQIAEIALEAGGHPQEHVAAHLGGAIGRGGLGHGCDVGVPLVGRARQPQQLVERLGGRGILLDGFGPPLEGRHLIDQLAFGDLGQPPQQDLPLGDVGGALELHLVDLVQLLPLLAGAVERLEHLGDLHLHGPAHEHPLERRAGLGMWAGSATRISR